MMDINLVYKPYTNAQGIDQHMVRVRDGNVRIGYAVREYPRRGLYVAAFYDDPDDWTTHRIVSEDRTGLKAAVQDIVNAHTVNIRRGQT